MRKNHKTSSPSARVKPGFIKFMGMSGVVFVISLLHQSLFAQTVNVESSADAYSNYLLVILVLLVTTIFIGLEILGNPRYESPDVIPVNGLKGGSASFINPEFVLDKKITNMLGMVIYISGILVILYAVLLWFMF